MKVEVSERREDGRESEKAQGGRKEGGEGKEGR